MALPSSGQLSLNNIRTELGIPSQSPFSLTTAAEGGYVTINSSSPSRPSASKPHKISDWYGYNHTYSAARTMSITFERLNGGTLSAFKNGTNVLTLTTSNTISTSISPGDTFFGRITVTSLNRADLEVVSTTRGGLYSVYTMTGTLTSPTFTLQSGEDIYIYGYSYRTCLIAGTLITLADKTKIPVELLKVGDMLKSAQINTLEDTNDASELVKWSTEILTETETTSKVVEISKEEVPFNVSFNEGMLAGSSRHIHLVKRENVWRFLRFGEIKIGDVFRDENKNEVEIVKVDFIIKPTTVYRVVLEVPSHTFYANGLLTHNIK